MVGQLTLVTQQLDGTPGHAGQRSGCGRPGGCCVRERGRTIAIVAEWWSIEVLHGEVSAFRWQEQHDSALIEAALTNGVCDGAWHADRWGVVFEVLFGTEEQWDAFRALPVVRAALDAVPDPVSGLLIYRGRGGGAGVREPRRPKPAPGSAAVSLPGPAGEPYLDLAAASTRAAADIRSATVGELPCAARLRSRSSGSVVLSGAVNLDPLVPVRMISGLQLVAYQGSVFPPLGQSAPHLLACPGMDAQGIVRDADDELTPFDLGRHQVGVFRAGPVFPGGSQQADRVHGHHGVPARSGTEVIVQAVQQERRQRFPHAYVFNRDELQPPPQMLSDISGGRQHLVGGEHGVVVWLGWPGCRPWPGVT